MSWSRAAALAAVILLVASAGPPPTPTVEHSETMFGMTFDDPYAWMEEGGPRFEAWMAAQNDYARSVLDRIPGRAGLLAELRRLNAGQTSVGNVMFAGGRWFYTLTRSDDPVARLFMRQGDHGAERLLIDPARFDSADAHGHLDYWSASPDGEHLVYGVSVGGAETGTLRVLDVASGDDLPGEVGQTRYAAPSWRDDASFVYTRLPAAGPDGRQSLTGGRVFLHRLGTDPAADPAVFGTGLLADTEVPEDRFVSAYASPGSAYVVTKYDTGLTSSNATLFIAPAESLDAGSPSWRRIATTDDRVRGVVLHRDWLYLRSERDAPRQKVLRTRLSAPDIGRAETVVPQGPATIAAIAVAQDALYIRLLNDGRGGLLRLPWSGDRAETILLPFAGSIGGMSASAGRAGVILRLQDWTVSSTVFAYDPADAQFRDTGLAPPSPVDFDDIEAREVRVPSSDGTLVPLTIVSRRDRPRGVPGPALLYGYGAYNVALEPGFNPLRRAWFDNNGVYALAHVRGSGGFGEAWYQAGRLESKPNSIGDFIACAEYLVREGWTTSGMLGVQGASAGGIVAGGAITARPDLFAAAILDVGLLNALRLERIPIGPFNTGEFGATDTEDGVRMLFAIDVTQQVRSGVAYPAVLIATGLNDTRISAWMSGKLAARLQAATSGSRPVLLTVDPKGGHMSSSRPQLEADTADFYSFLLWQAGVPGFQPLP